ncbi:MAG: protocatechuate 3,4-dioxygenase [Pseudomonadota bacterium]
MARVVLGMGLSHTPQLHTPPDQWDIRVEADRRNKAHQFRGKTYDWEALKVARGADHLGAEASMDRRTARLNRAHQSLEKLAEIYHQTRPDIAVIVGNDQHELFDDSITPAFTVFWGDKIENIPRSEDQIARLPAGIHIADRGHVPPETQIYPGLPGLGRHIIESTIAEEFDVAHSRFLHKVDPDHSILSGIPHAYGFVYRQIMKDNVIPNVPIILNTFYPPNQPSVRRCFAFGQAIGRAIKSWSEDRTVAVIGSGGLSHFVVDPQFDRAFLDALRTCDVAAMAVPGEAMYQSGTSECKNWITTAGILSTTALKMNLLSYDPFIRSEGGTGTGAAFAYWN